MDKKTLIIIPNTFSNAERIIAAAISKIAHDFGGSVCHTSDKYPSFKTLEERHQDRVRDVLDNGGRVYAFAASTDLTDMGVINLGNIRMNAEERVEAIFAAE